MTANHDTGGNEGHSTGIESLRKWRTFHWYWVFDIQWNTFPISTVSLIDIADSSRSY